MKTPHAPYVLAALLTTLIGLSSAVARADPAPSAGLDLASAIRAADEGNVSLRVLHSRLTIAAADVKRSWAALVPNVSANASLVHLDQADETSQAGQTITTRRQDTVAGQLRVDVPLVDATLWMGVGSARVSERIAALGFEQGRQALLLGTAQAWFQAQSAAQLVSLYEAQLLAAERHREVASLRHRSGVGARLDVVRAERQVAALREQLLSSQSTLDVARDALGTITGQGGRPTPVGEARLPRPANGDATASIDRRQDLRIGHAEIELAERQVTQSWARFAPSLGASWQLDHQFTKPVPMGDGDRTSWTAMLTLSVPIFNWGRYADLDAGRAAREQLRFALAETKRDAEQELRTLSRELEATTERSDLSESQVSLAREELALSERAYAEGTGSSLAVTDARSTIREAEVARVRLSLEAELLTLQLLRATGRDLAEVAAGELVGSRQ